MRDAGDVSIYATLDVSIKVTLDVSTNVRIYICLYMKEAVYPSVCIPLALSRAIYDVSIYLAIYLSIDPCLNVAKTLLLVLTHK